MSNPFKKVPWKTVFGITTNVLEVLVPEVAQIEKLAKTIPQIKQLTGPEKKAAVLVAVQGALETAEGLADRDLLNDPDVLLGAGGIVDAVVAFQNIVAAKQAERAAAGA